MSSPNSPFSVSKEFELYLSNLASCNVAKCEYGRL